MNDNEDVPAPDHRALDPSELSDEAFAALKRGSRPAPAGTSLPALDDLWRQAGWL